MDLVVNRRLCTAVVDVEPEALDIDVGFSRATERNVTLSEGSTSVHPTFEGGQMPLVRRIPKRGFNNRWALTVAIVNLGDLQQRFDDGDEVTPDTLRAKNLAKGRYDQLKVLANGELTKKLAISAHKFSRSAVEKIEKAGGQVVILPGKAPVVKNKQKPK